MGEYVYECSFRSFIGVGVISRYELFSMVLIFRFSFFVRVVVLVYNCCDIFFVLNFNYFN